MVTVPGADSATLSPLIPQKETPLANAAFWAARRGNLALLRLLLNSGRVDVDCRDSVRRPRRDRVPRAPPNTFPSQGLATLTRVLALSVSKSAGDGRTT